MLIKNPCWDPNKSEHALNIIKHYGKDAYTPEQKAWVLDQVTRALTNCPLEIKMLTTMRGDLEIEMLGESAEYQVLTRIAAWDKGIPI